MLITVPGKKELNNYDGRYGYYRSETTDFVLLQNPNISLSEWWSSIYGKQNNFRFIEIYSSIDSVDYLAEEKSLIEKSIYESTGIKYGTRPLIKDLNNVLDEKKIINKNSEIIRYVIVGGLTTLVSLLSYYICIWLFLNPDNGVQLQVANIISWILSVTFAYFANRKYVFKSNGKVIGEVVEFYSSRILTLLIDMLSMFLMVTLFHIDDKIAKILVQFIILVLNYIFSKYLVFNNKKSKIKNTIIK